MAKIELNVLLSQCLKRPMDSLAQVKKAVSVWQARRDNLTAMVDWRFAYQDVRIILRRLYPILDE